MIAACTPDWMIISCPAPSRVAIDMASAITTTSCQTPLPKIRTNRSPTPTPTATPMATSTARRIRCPKLTPRVTIAATGAKNGSLWPSTSWARNQASPAVIAICPMMNQRDRQRWYRSTSEARPAFAPRSLRSYARRVIRRNAGNAPAGSAGGSMLLTRPILTAALTTGAPPSCGAAHLHAQHE